jgi:ABC-type thiamine transport system substrate-binding protein
MPRNALKIAVAVSLCATPLLTACGGTSAASDAKVVTVYSADGLKGENGDGWYDQVFKDFEKRTGIQVKYVEGGSGEMVQRAVREKSNPQADVLVTLPPFIQQADSKGLLQKYTPAGADQVSGADKAPTAPGPPSSTTTSGSSTTRSSSPKRPPPGTSCSTASTRTSSSTPRPESPVTEPPY